MTGIDWLSVLFAGVGILMLVLSPLAKQTGGYQRPLDPFGAASLAERRLFRRRANSNQNPRAALIKGGLAFIAAAILLQFFRVF